ncbi:hypothetical protein K458DRAFT_89763 [Lentithecium fluviatile CBS 122367]|uniref:Uncharacterized protein n=1 Tax=Lentithecium fluviatile CBS 122367 TaxID=1168545 RepID=A0A6G1IS09_9PLEO|nr:hypothetical protein K458DRAFT_89763 [Lentithecium fluviatile CBS 122367]
MSSSRATRKKRQATAGPDLEPGTTRAGPEQLQRDPTLDLIRELQPDEEYDIESPERDPEDRGVPATYPGTSRDTDGNQQSRTVGDTPPESSSGEESGPAGNQQGPDAPSHSRRRGSHPHTSRYPSIAASATGSNTIPIHGKGPAPARQESGSAAPQSVQSLKLELFSNWARLRSENAPESAIAEAKAIYDTFVAEFETSVRSQEPAGSATEAQRKAIQSLSRARDAPELGNNRKPPSVQQIERWIKNVNRFMDVHFATEDSIQRTRWIVTLVKYDTYRDILDREVDSDHVTTWAQTQQRIRNLAEDPVLTKYGHYARFWNIEWRTEDPFNVFYNRFTNELALLNMDPFGGPQGEMAKVSFVWSRCPEPIRREVQRAGQLKNVTDWLTFERAIRDAETAVQIADLVPKGNHRQPGQGQTAGGKRAAPASDQSWRGKRHDRKPSSKGSRTQGERPSSTTPSRSESVASSSREQPEKVRKPHWKQRGRDDKADPSRKEKS